MKMPATKGSKMEWIRKMKINKASVMPDQNKKRLLVTGDDPIVRIFLKSNIDGSQRVGKGFRGAAIMNDHIYLLRGDGQHFELIDHGKAGHFGA